MSGPYPNDQGNPAGAIPVYFGTQPGGGGDNAAFESLNAVTSPGAGTAKTFNNGQRNISMQVDYTSTPTVVTVNLEGSVDGTNFFQLAQFLGGSTQASASGAMVVSTDVPVIKARANLITLTGGSTPAVTAWILAG